MTRILLADDHAVLREGLKALISTRDSWNVVAEASDGFEVMKALEEQTVDIVVLDLSMPKLGGVETIARLRKLDKPPRILVLSARDDEASVSEVLRAGANGFIPKASTRDEILLGIDALTKGQTYISPAVANAVIGPAAESTSVLDVLSDREREVMKLLCEGHKNKDIAKMLHISARTVDTHRSNIKKKLGADSNAELTQIALRYQLIE